VLQLARFLSCRRFFHLTAAAVTSEALDIDEKNYHAWAHRQVLVQMYGAWEQELAYVEAMINRDVRNNSAWNQRAFLLKVRLREVEKEVGGFWS
jgi:protein farnesyltransferase/geranylgeranyltransferase type-1 subunit alpha